MAKVAKTYVKPARKTSPNAFVKKDDDAGQCPSPKRRKDRRKLRFLQNHIEDLPWQVVELLDNSRKHEQGRLINQIVVGSQWKRHCSGEWRFNLDAPYLQDSARG